MHEKYEVFIFKDGVLGPLLKQFKIYAKDLNDFAKVKQFFYCGNDPEQAETLFEDFATFVRFVMNLNQE